MAAVLVWRDGKPCETKSEKRVVYYRETTCERFTIAKSCLRGEWQYRAYARGASASSFEPLSPFLPTAAMAQDAAEQFAAGKSERDRI